MTEEKFEEFVYRVVQKHGDIFDFSKAKPNTVKDKMIVICKKHNIEFETTFDALIHGSAKCPVCSGKYRNTRDFIMKVKEIHGEKYDLSKVKYTGAKNKVTVICHEKDEFGDEHGEFQIRASNLIYGTGCPKCGNHYTYTVEEWIRKARKVHGDRYDYSKVKSTRIKDKIEIICPEHGSFFQAAGSHLQGCGCPGCNGGTAGNKEEFIKKANEVHHNHYNYDKFVYVNRKTKGIIICPVHGEFMLDPDKHLIGVGCPKCKSSKLENIILTRLNRNNINYVYQSKVLGLGQQSIDFYIKERNLMIECQGEQHYIPVKFSKKITDEDADKLFEERKRLDKEKYDKALSMGIEIVYFVIPSYFCEDNVDINLPFYEDKKVFTDADKLVEYVLSKEVVYSSETFHDFVNDFKSHVSSDVVLISDSSIRSNKFIFNYVPVKSNERDSLNNMSRMYRKKGISVIHIFEDEYVQHRDIVLSKLRHILKLDSNLEKIYGRKCTISEIDNKTAFEFLERNHVQGGANGTVHLGAFYNNRLIGVMSFLNEGKNKWNLVRFASDINCICCGVGSKLFRYFTDKYEYSEIKSFADKRWTYNEDDNIYVKTGFVFDKRLMPEYRYIKSDGSEKIRHHKFGFRKHILNKKYGLSLKLTEKEMTQELGYDRIWDCGLIKYIYRNS